MNTITPNFTSRSEYIKKECNKATRIVKKHYVKPEIKVYTVESDSQMLAASDMGHDNGNHNGWWNGNHNGWDNGNGNGNGHGRGMEYDDSFFLDN